MRKTLPHVLSFGKLALRLSFLWRGLFEKQIHVIGWQKQNQSNMYF